MAQRYPDPFDVLAQAQGVALGPTGVAAYRSLAFEAYERALPIAAQHHELLMDMVQHATPAGRLYAALLLVEAGSARATEAWQRLALDDEEVSYAPGGCSVFNTTLAGYARGVLQGGPPSLFTGSPRAAQKPASTGSAPVPKPEQGRMIAWWRLNGWWLIGLFWVTVTLAVLLLQRR